MVQTQDSRPSPEVEDFRARLRAEAWQETVRQTVESLARRPGAVGAAVASLKGDQAWVRSLPTTAAGMADAMADRLRTACGDDVAEAVKRDVDWELHTFRGGRKVETCFRFEAMEAGIDSRPSDSVDLADHPADEVSAPSPERGFDADIAAMDVDASHSMGDLSRYAAAYFGQTFLDAVVEPRCSLEMHHGSLEEALASMRSRGLTSFHRLRTPRLHYQIVFAWNRHDGKVRAALVCDDGVDMARHLQKVMRVARASDGSRVRTEQILRFDHRPHEVAYRPARLQRCFESAGPIPAQVTVGFKNALLGELHRRAQWVETARVLQRLLASLDLTPCAPELERLGLADLGRVSQLTSSELLGSAERVASLEALHLRARDVHASEEATVRRLGLQSVVTPSGLATARPVRLTVTDGPDAFLDHSRLTYAHRTGALRSVLLTRNPYGSVSEAVGRLFRRVGVTDVLIVGTAAALERTAEVGTLHLPAAAVSADGVLTRFENHALRAAPQLLRRPDVRAGTQVVNVRSPIDEFDRDIERLRAEGHHLIEMELAGLVRGLEGHARLSAIYIVSDVPQSAHTLGSFSAASVGRAIAAAVDAWVRHFEIGDLPVVPG